MARTVMNGRANSQSFETSFVTLRIVERMEKKINGVETGKITPMTKSKIGIFPFLVNMRSPVKLPFSSIRAPDQTAKTDTHRLSPIEHMKSFPALLDINSSKLKASIPITHQHELGTFVPARQ
jgi:hypothetical protein